MKRACVAVVVAMLLGIVLVCRVSAQDELGEDSRVNTNLAVTITAPLNPTAHFVNVGGGFVVGAGYNASKRNAFIGEFMWNRLGASDAALAPIRSALQTHNINGHGNLYVLTGNYRFELRGKTTGIYFIGGGGWYHRTANVTTHVATGSSITCTPTWLWWGFDCQSGTVTSNQTLASSTSDTLGANVGLGITFKVAEPRYRIYLEARYHYAPTKNVKTELIPISMGIRF
jgi:hypothetical protein